MGKDDSRHFSLKGFEEVLRVVGVKEVGQEGMPVTEMRNTQNENIYTVI